MFLPTVVDMEADRDRLTRWRHGVIEVSGGRLVAIHRQLWSKCVSLFGVWWFQWIWHEHRAGDYCRLYYSQPAHLPQFLALKFVVSYRNTSFSSFHGALRVLDEIARLKKTDAIVCEVRSSKISARLLHRWGWERHLVGSHRRHYIKRFYGKYSETPLPAELLRALPSGGRTSGDFGRTRGLLARDGHGP
jgi:hypothetical protein